MTTLPPPNAAPPRPLRLAINAVPLRPGGGLTVLLGLLRGLQGLKGRVSTSVVCRHKATFEQIEEAGTAGHVELVGDGRGDLAAILWQRFRLGRWAKSQQADALLSFNHHAPSVRVPQVVYHINLRRFAPLDDIGGPLEWVKEKLRDAAARRAIHDAAANVFESRYLKEQALRAFPSDRTDHDVAYIGLPDELIERSHLGTGSAVQRPDLLAITSPFPHKDNPTLIRTLAELVRRQPDVPWRLLVAGGGPGAWTDEQRLAEELGVASHVEWLGFCDQTRLDSLLRSALCLVAPSRLESFAMVALESMARRCPAIVADTAAMPESVGSAGLLARPGDAASFADAVQRIQSSPELRESLVSAGLEWISPLRWSSCGEDFGRILQRVAA